MGVSIKQVMPVCESTSSSRGVCSSGRKLVLRYLSSPSLGTALAINNTGSFTTCKRSRYREGYVGGDDDDDGVC